jgi:hypothetical protein
MALGSVPILGQVMALRDMERARRAQDPVAGGLAAASLLPFGKLAGPLRKIMGGAKAVDPPQAVRDAVIPLENTIEDWTKKRAYIGPEGLRKFEIDDAASKLKFDPKSEKYFDANLEDILEHPELFRQYPDLAKLQVTGAFGPNEKMGGGYLAPFKKGDVDLPESIEVTGANFDEFRSSLLHEIQHAVQQREGFQPGANPEFIKRLISDLRVSKNEPQSFKDTLIGEDLYAKTMGEAEARMVERRLLNSPAYNRNIHPTESYDRPLAKLLRREQIYGDDLGILPELK